MTTTISIMDIRKSIGDSLNKVSIRDDEYIVERKGEPLAAIIPILKLRMMERAAKSQTTDILSKSSSSLNEERSLALTLEAKEFARSK
jgi:antitoxin (DNA-binding transcriptional repressor) of toxin-antitoxin stability system